MNYQIVNGDCREELQKFLDNSFDSVVTDPPYGLSKEPDITEVLTKWLAGEDYTHASAGFMGKTWDSFVPGPSIWREVYRVLKPGGYALVFAGTRTQDLMTISLRLAGFEVRDVVEWLYFSGFPKSMDVGVALDKLDARDARRERALMFTEWMRSTGLSAREINLATSSNMSNHYLTDKEQPSVATREMFELIRPLLSVEVPEWIEIMVEERTVESKNYKRREKVGDYEYKRKGEGTWDAESPSGMFGAQVRTVDITAPATDLAKKWDGWGTALKPAHEPVIVVRKPLDGTVAENVERYGVGALNIDSCRIIRGKGDRTKYGVDGDEPSSVTNGIYGKFSERLPYTPDEAGRFPANAITTDADAFYSPYFNVTPQEVCKKASKADRGAGNTHPTVKPTDLMAWLVRLVTPPGGTVLDPFAGSGSTLVAAKREGFDFVGIEYETDYVEICKSRTNHQENGGRNENAKTLEQMVMS